MNRDRQLSRSLHGLAFVALLAATAGHAEESNRYAAPFTSTAPTIDGLTDTLWRMAPWDTLAYNYLAGTSMPTPSDLSARYKAAWNADALYLLVEVVDDSISDRTVDPLKNWWNDDCVEIFLDEDRSGGDHQYDFNAWAYHVGTKYDAVDYGDDQQPHLFNDHVRVRRTQTGDTSVWEMAIRVYGDDYRLAGTNTPRVLTAAKIMGFSLAYCDNDGPTSRESFIGSVNTPGHLANEGYLDASVFGTLELLAPPPTSASPRNLPPSVQRRIDAFRFQTTGRVSIRRMDGSVVRQSSPRPGTWLGSDLAPGLYAVRQDGPEGTTDFVFAKP